MAILKGRKKNIDNLNSPTISIGVALPLLNPQGGTLSIREQSKTNLINLLLTQPGERLYMPEFGVGIKSYIFENIINKASLQEKIDQQINIYIPEIELIDVDINPSEIDNKLYIKIAYDIIATNSVDVIQLNFDPNQAYEPQGLTPG